MIIVNSEKRLNDAIEMLRQEFKRNKYLQVTVKSGRKRTSQQNAALHVFCADLANTLNASGLEFRTFFKEGVKIPFDAGLVKDHIWRPIQRAVCKHNSTTQPTPEQYIEIFEVLARHLAENHGIYVEWPHKDYRND